MEGLIEFTITENEFKNEINKSAKDINNIPFDMSRNIKSSQFEEWRVEDHTDQYQKAIHFVQENGCVKIGTLMRMFRISATWSLSIIEKLKKDNIIDDNLKLITEKKHSWV